MNGWNPPRPTWDPEGGIGDSTPDFPEPEDHGRHSRNPYAQSGKHGQPSQLSFPGYDPEDLWPQARGEGGGYSNGTNGQHASGSSDPLGFPPFPAEEYPAADYGQSSQPFGQRDSAQPGPTGRHASRGGSEQEYAARMDPALQDFFAPQPPRPDFGRSGQQPASGPQPAQPSQPSQPGYPGRSGYPDGPQPGGQPLQRDDQPRRPGAPTAPRQPSHAAQGSQRSQAPWGPQPSQPPRSPSAPPWAAESGQAPHKADPWDAPAPRQGSRAASHASHASHDSRGSGGSRVKVLIAAIVVVVLAIAAVWFLVIRKHNTTTPTATPPTTAPARTTPSASQSASAKATQAATGTAYTLSTPATAGGYPKAATVASSVSSTATATAQSIREQAVSSGGKVTSTVTGYYQLSSGQVMSFAGYQGTFDPAKVLASLGQVGQGGQTYSAGAHGGDLACIPSAGTPGGTVCVWVTTTTLGVTGFFAANGAPENVTNQAKAAQDTVNFRADVEAAKS